MWWTVEGFAVTIVDGWAVDAEELQAMGEEGVNTVGSEGRPMGWECAVGDGAVGFEEETVGVRIGETRSERL